jgi:hypothetical protein
MKTENSDRQLNQIIAGGDHQQMKQRQPEKGVHALTRGKSDHIEPFLTMG